MANEDAILAQRLECALCFELLQEPKELICTHSFCQRCLAKLHHVQPSINTLSCPICRKITELKDGDVSLLQTNIPLKSMIGDLESVKKSCTNCDPVGKSAASVYCQDCEAYFCEECLDIHRNLRKNANHEVISSDKVKSGKGKGKNVCLKHPQEEIELVCTSCNISICFKCRVLHHHGPEHKVDEVSEVRKRMKVQIESIQKKGEEKMSLIGRYIDHVNEQDRKVRLIMGDKVAEITNAYEKSVQQLTQGRDELIEECKKSEENIGAQLHKIREETSKIFNSIKSASELIANGMKGVLVGQTLDVHSTLCNELEHILGGAGQDISELTRFSSQAKEIEFKQYLGERGLELGEIKRKTAPPGDPGEQKGLMAVT